MHLPTFFVRLFFALFVLSFTSPQTIVPDVHPTPLLRLTGVLEIVRDPQPSVFPVLRVWIDDRPRIFRVAHVEAVFSSYHAEEQTSSCFCFRIAFPCRSEGSNPVTNTGYA